MNNFHGYNPGYNKTESTDKIISQLLACTYSPSQFDSLRSKFISFNLEDCASNGMNVLGAAAYKADLALIEHIDKLTDKKLLNQKDKLGWTPLHHAINGKWSLNACKAINKLVALGALINVPENRQFDISPLKFAVDNGKNIKITKLLIRLKATSDLPFSYSGNWYFQDAMEQLKAEARYLTLKAGSIDSKSNLNRLPQELQTAIIDLLLHKIR